MKIFILISFFLSSCQSNPAEQASINPVDQQILGEWGIYVTTYGKSSTLCNACPKINFQKTGIAEVIKPSKDREVYTWVIKGDTLLINAADSKTNAKAYVFDRHAQFVLKFSKKKGYEELVLKAIKNDVSYTLRQ